MAYRRAPGMGQAPCESLASLRTCCDSCAQGGSCGRGLSGCGCAGLCGRRGLGLFETGLDFSGWGWPEVAIVALGGYMLLSTVFTTQRATRRVGKSFKRYQRRMAKGE